MRVKQTQLLNQRKKLQFAIRSDRSNFVRSSVWFAKVNRDDVYLSSQGVAGIVKVSLHASGKCSYSLTSEMASHSSPKPSPNREITCWQRGAFDTVEHTKALELYFILIGGGQEAQAETLDMVLLPNAPLGFSTEVSVFFSATNPLEWKSRHWLVSNIIGTWQLSSGHYVCLRRRVIPLPGDDLQRILSIGNSGSLMVVGDENPEFISGALATCILSEATPHLGRIYVLEKVDLSNQMGLRATWSTRNGNKRKPT